MSHSQKGAIIIDRPNYAIVTILDATIIIIYPNYVTIYKVYTYASYGPCIWIDVVICSAI